MSTPRVLHGSSAGGPSAGCGADPVLGALEYAIRLERHDMAYALAAKADALFTAGVGPVHTDELAAVVLARGLARGSGCSPATRSPG